VSANQKYARAGGNIAGRDQFNIESLTVNLVDPSLADEKIPQELKILRASRQFSEFDRLGEARRFAERCMSGNLSSGTGSVRASAIAWCARILSQDDPKTAQQLIGDAERLDSSPEIEVAKAFVISKTDGKAAALASLSDIGTTRARAAMLSIVFTHDGRGGALEWFAKTGLEAAQLDADGKALLLDIQIQERDWAGAKLTAEACDNTDWDENPLLLLGLAFENFLRIVPEEFRPIVHAQLPFQLARFDLASGADASQLHLEAQAKFQKATERFREMNMHKAADITEGYDLWLALLHPELRASGQERVRAILRNADEALRIVHIALNFEIPLDLDAVERAIDKKVALSGGGSGETALARLSLSLTQPSKAKVAEYIERHRGELEPWLDPRSIGFLEIEMLSASGQADEAQRVFSKLDEDGLLEENERARLNLVMAEGTSNDPVAARRVQYEQSKSLGDLKNLVDSLEDGEDWAQLALYGSELYNLTHSTQSAEQMSAGLVKSGQDTAAVDFLNENASLVEQSRKLRVLRCWALYRSGDMLEAKKALAFVPEENENHAILRRNIAVATGDWQELSQIVGDICQKMDDHSPEELIQAAYLGFQVGSPSSKTLLFAAAERADDDPAVLSRAYFLATQAGLEDEPKVGLWLNRAAELSGEDGPLRTASLEEILEMQPDWNRRQEKTSEMLRNGEIPMFMAAQSLNRSLIEMVLTPLLANQDQDDPRRRIPVYAFSGKRVPFKIKGVPKKVGMDTSVLLTFSGLGLLDLLKTAPFKIRIAHSALQWLLEEKRRVAFHQPSRIHRAQKLQDLIATNKVKVFAPSSMADDELVNEVGDELASMIGDAEDEAGSEISARKYVVRSAPVRKIGSLMQEDADLSAHSSVLVSCQSVLEKLVSRGRLMGAEAKRASSYLKLHEQRWPSEPEISDRSTLLLDSLSVEYLQSCQLLENLCDAGFTVMVSERYSDECRSLLNYQRLSDKLDSSISELHAFLLNGIQLGKIEINSVGRNDEQDDEERSFRSQPTAQTLLLDDVCDVVAFDDRFVNQHPNISLPGSVSRPIWTSTDLLRVLCDSDILDQERAQEAVTKLRRGGYLFMEVDEDEVFGELCSCNIVDGQVQETAELRSIRENFTFIRLCKVLRTSDETPWLDRSISSFLMTYRRVWGVDEDFELRKARAEWLLDLLDIRGWLSSFPYEQAQYILNEGRATHLAVLIAPPANFDEALQEYFLEWVSERILVPLMRECLELFEKIVQLKRDTLESYLDSDILEEVDVDG